jgi:hypothetical protein
MPLGLTVLLAVLGVTALFALVGYVIDKDEQRYEREQDIVDSASEMEKVTKQK